MREDKDDNKTKFNASLNMAKAAGPEDPDQALANYLQKVYRTIRQFGSDLPGSVRHDLSQLGRDLHPSCHANPFRVVVEKTAPGHVSHKTRWIYARALKHAFDRKIKTKDLKAFIEESGGIKQCGAAKAKRRPKDKKPVFDINEW